MSISDRLDQIEQRAKGATEGPWEVLGDEDYGYEVHGQREPSSIPGVWRPTEVCGPGQERNAEFIAHARTDVPALVAALRAVVGPHKPFPDHAMGFRDDGTYGAIDPACGACGTPDEYAVPWPCPTYRAVAEALGEDIWE